MSSAVYSSNAPRALVTFTDILPTADRITIYRTADARTEEVRGGVDLSAESPFAMDYEVAPGVTNSWRAQMFAADGTDLGFTGEVTLEVPGNEGMWLQQPLAPETAIRVRVSIESGETIRKPSPGDIIYPEGANVGRMIGGQRRGISGMSLTLFAEYNDLGRIDDMLGGPGADYPSVLLLRTPPPWRLPRVFFMAVPNPEEFRAGMYALSGFKMTATEVAPPYPGLIQALLRRKDIDAAYATRAARAAAYATRLARDSDYSLAGFGG